MITEDLVLSLDPPDPYAFSSVWFALGAMAGAIVGIGFMLVVDRIASRASKRGRQTVRLEALSKMQATSGSYDARPMPRPVDGVEGIAFKCRRCSRFGCSCAVPAEMVLPEQVARPVRPGCVCGRCRPPAPDLSTDNVKRTDILP